MSDFTVVQRGFDTNGRPIRATRAMWDVWDDCCDELGFEPTIVQGGHMGSSGASASAGTHDGDAFDLRLWDRKQDERDAMIRVFRGRGAFAYWERYPTQGFDLHAHMVPGPWARPAPGALTQWHAYLNNRDGLAGNREDYHWRPNPLVLTPMEDDMPLTDEDLDKIATKVWAKELGSSDNRRPARALLLQSANAAASTRGRLSTLAQDISEAIDEGVNVTELRRQVTRLREAIAELEADGEDPEIPKADG
jgi:hypothetical protein